MPFNGSGSFSVVNTFLPNTTILSALVNGNNTDFASGLSNCMCKDGQQVAAANQPMGNFKLTGLGSGSARTDSISLGQTQDGGINWVVSGGTADAITATYAPALTALVDGQLCYFRATAANATTTPTFAPNGLTAHTITKVGGTALVAGDIPGNLAECALRYNLANTRWELVNPAVPTASIGAAQFAVSAFGQNEPINLQLVASVGSNLLTVAVKTTAFNDPSLADPVFIPFRDVTLTNGETVVFKLTSALSINTFATGATLGSSNSTAFRLWVVAFNNSGSAVLALINCLNSSGNIFPLNDTNVQSSTPISGSANTAGVFYTPNGTTITSKALCVLGYIEYNATGLATAGTYNIAPQFVQLAGPNTPRPGREVQRQFNFTGAEANNNSTIMPNDDTIPQNTEGDQYMTQAITPISAANVLHIEHLGNYQTGGTNYLGIALFQDSTANALATSYNNPPINTPGMYPLQWIMQAGTASSTTFKIRAGSTSSSTITFNGLSSARKFGGSIASYLGVREIMA